MASARMAAMPARPVRMPALQAQADVSFLITQGLYVTAEAQGLAGFAIRSPCLAVTRHPRKCCCVCGNFRAGMRSSSRSASPTASGSHSSTTSWVDEIRRFEGKAPVPHWLIPHFFMYSFIPQFHRVSRAHMADLAEDGPLRSLRRDRIGQYTAIAAMRNWDYGLPPRSDS